jgi:hypothetical protein
VKQIIVKPYKNKVSQERVHFSVIVLRNITMPFRLKSIIHIHLVYYVFVR